VSARVLERVASATSDPDPAPDELGPITAAWHDRRWARWLGRGLAITVRAGGCCVRTAGTDAPASFRWSEVTALHVEPGGRIAIDPGWPYRTRRTAFAARIETARWRLCLGYRHLDAVRAIEAALMPELQARLAAALAAGASLHFGPIAASVHGLRLRGDRYAWPDLAGLHRTGGLVTLLTHSGRSASVFAADISFLAALEDVVLARTRL
jgi:hypothetical protein